MKTLGELLRQMDDAKAALRSFDMTNHYAYLRWLEADRIEFDVNHEKARQQLEAATQESRARIAEVAAADKGT